jgi:hypothetical protein
MPLITSADRQAMARNAVANVDPMLQDPVVKLVLPAQGAAWLLARIEGADVVTGICDFGAGNPEHGAVLLSQLEALRDWSGSPVERVEGFRAEGDMGAYLHAAVRAGRIVDLT